MAKKKETNDSELSEKDRLNKEFIEQLNKSFKDPGMAFLLGSNARLDVKTVSTGSLAIDSIIGGGLPYGRVIEIYGPEASGKTSLALTAVGNVQKSGGNAFYIDVEHALDPVYARRLGVNTAKLGFSQPSYAEQALNILNEIVKSGVYDIVVLDSVASLTPRAELSGTMDDNSVGLLARKMGQALRMITPAASKTNTIVVFINQTREKVGVMFGSPETTPGGKALKFYASQRIRVQKIKVKKDKDVAIGTLVKVECKKNKIAPPYGKAETVLTFSRGINVSAEVIEICVAHHIINNARGRFTDAETGESLAFGEQKFIDLLDDRSNGLYDKYYAKAKKVLDARSAEEAAEPEDAVPDDGDSPALVDESALVDPALAAADAAIDAA